MNKYDYLGVMVQDILDWMENESFDLNTFYSEDDARDYLESEMWADDSITGNGGLYYASEFKCEEYVCHNLNLLLEAFSDFSFPDSREIRNRLNSREIARYCDCTIRCYLLSAAIDKALEEWKKNEQRGSKTSSFT